MTLDGKQLRYLIGGEDDYEGADNEVVELSYDAERLPKHGVGIKYGNLFNEKYSKQSPAERARYAPYLEQGDTAAEYKEGQIDPAGPGWDRNLDEQFARAKAQGFEIIELDNPDSYSGDEVMDAVDRAAAAGLKMVAKNPWLVQNATDYVEHPAIVGIIVERDAGTPREMDALRSTAGKPTLPVWFVAYGSGKSWADRMADEIDRHEYVNMGVTFSDEGEYETSVDVFPPKPVPPVPVPPVPVVEITAEAVGDVQVILQGPGVTAAPPAAAASPVVEITAEATGNAKIIMSNI